MMRLGILALALLAFSVAHADTQGALWGDSTATQVAEGSDEDIDFADPGAGDGGGAPGSGPGAGDEGSGGASGDTDNGQDSGAGESSEEPPSVIISEGVIVVSDSSGASGTSGTFSAGASASNDEKVLVAELLEILSETGAIAVSADASSAGGSGGVSVSGSLVRESLEGRGDLRLILRRWAGLARAGAGGRSLSAGDLGLIAASTALQDRHVGDAFISLSSFNLAYRSQGYLLGLVPIAFQVRLSVVPDAKVAAERVVVKFPWYQFFVRKFVSKATLVREITALIDGSDTEAAPAERQARLFTAVTDFLATRSDTVEGSLQ